MENGAIRLCPLFPVFLMLPLESHLDPQAWGVCELDMCWDRKKVGLSVGGDRCAGDFYLGPMDFC